MEKVKLLKILVIGLLVSNILLIGFIVFPKPRHDKPGGPRDLIIEKLHFDKTQISKYDKLINKHRHEISATETEIRQMKSQLYGSLSSDAAQLNKDSLIVKISQLNVKIELINYKHFEDIKQLCKPNQKEDFNSLSKELGSLFSKQKPKRNRP